MRRPKQDHISGDRLKIFCYYPPSSPAAMKAIALFVCLLAPGCPEVLQAAPVISEILASNSRILADEDGDFSDWIEIYNPSSAPVSLHGYYLTDDSAFLAKWRLSDDRPCPPPGSLEPTVRSLPVSPSMGTSATLPTHLALTLMRVGRSTLGAAP